MVCRTVDGIGRTGYTLVVWDRCPRFQRVAKDIQAGRSMDSRGHGASVQGITDSECWLEVAVCDAGFGALGDEIEDCSACGFRAGTRGGGHSNQRLQLCRDGLAAAKRCVDEVEEVGLWSTVSERLTMGVGQASIPGKEVYKFISFAVSITDPPPTAKKASGW